MIPWPLWWPFFVVSAVRSRGCSRKFLDAAGTGRDTKTINPDDPQPGGTPIGGH